MITGPPPKFHGTRDNFVVEARAPVDGVLLGECRQLLGGLDAAKCADLEFLGGVAVLGVQAEDPSAGRAVERVPVVGGALRADGQGDGEEAGVGVGFWAPAASSSAASFSSAFALAASFRPSRAICSTDSGVVGARSVLRRRAMLSVAKGTPYVRAS